MEEREIAVNKVETTRDQENYQHEQRFSKLSFEYEKLKSDYNNVSSDYENRIRTMEEDQEDFISGLNTRK